MRQVGGTLFLSPSDLMVFLACRHATHLDLRALTEDLKKSDDDAISRLLKRKGTEHEARHLSSLQAQHGKASVEVIDGGLSDDDREVATQAAMKRGAAIVYQAALRSGNWRGFADFLQRVEEPSGLGDFGYEAVDTKLSRQVHGKYALQLGIYSAFLEAVQKRRPRYMHVQLGDGTAHRLRVNNFLAYLNDTANRLVAFTQAPPKTSYPERCSYCAQCGWRDNCEGQWRADDHLVQVANIRNDAIEALNRAGIHTLKALAEFPDGNTVPGVSTSVLDRLRAQATLQLRKRETGTNEYILLPISMGHGFDLLPEPDAGDLFFDMEGDPFYPGGLEYLFGFAWRDNGALRYTAFWAHDKEAESRVTQEVISFLADHLSKHPKAHVYHYNTYEDRALKRLASLYGTGEAALDDMLRQERFVDLYRIAREALQISEPGYSLKNFEVFFADKREGEVASAQESIVAYEEWRATNSQTLLDQIAAYNEKDCRSTVALLDWLVSLRPKTATWFVSKAADPQAAKSDNLREAEERLAQYAARMLLPETDPRHALSKLAFQLLEFHRRENKPRFWRMYDRQGQSVDALIEDAECVGAAKRDKSIPALPVKKSRAFTYTFPPQDLKLRTGDTVLDSATLDEVGTLHAIDEDAHTLAIKVGPKKADPAMELCLIPNPAFRDKAVREAMYRFADSVIADDNQFQAVRSILEKRLPVLDGVEPGSPIQRVGETPLDAARRAIPLLRSSHLFVQGPPGSGKTYAASQAIVDLIAAGKRVGVSSNSHKAIINLLKAVEKTAKQRKVTFSGVKRSDEDRPDTLFSGEFIKDALDNKEVDLTASLIAGTVYLFARPELRNAVDVLFIDEAGQVSLANVVAMGMAAANIVLIGDQMQLSQPIQGVHPDESGLSVLEFLLGDSPTISDRAGVFLAKTRRLHSTICKFISDAVYDGRLQSMPDCDRRVLILDGTAHPALATSGIRMVETDHVGCSQKSEDEAKIVAGVYRSLLNQNYVDDDGARQAIRAKNILVVSPYNMQVNLLKARLPEGALVGTVDRFQGQEAEVVIVSMATSSGDDLPRDIEFLFSRNRLNVAISRAKSLAIVVMNRRLLDIDCETIQQMRLVNTLCWLRQYAQGEKRSAFASA
jgi:uncharacterized protein